MPGVPITVLYEPARQKLAESGAEGQWSDPLASYRSLADALEQCSDGPVSLLNGFLRDAPPGVVLVRSSDYGAMMAEVGADQRAMAGRTILLDADGSNVFSLLERHRFAGAVGKQRFFAWCTEPDQETGGGLHCRRDLVAAIGGACLDIASFQTAGYCVVVTDRYTDLPSLIVGYAEALAAAGCT